jgi:hypothetical protein
MSLPKKLQVFMCVLFIAIAAPAQEIDSSAQKPARDSAGSDERFDSFLDNLITKIQTDIEQSISKKKEKNVDAEEQFTPSDSHDVTTGDYLVPRNEIVDRDMFLRDGVLTVEGILRGDANVLHGEIVVKEGGRITGNAHVIGGSVFREKNGIVEGEIRESSSDRGGPLGQRFNRRSSYSFPPRWLHENLYSDDFVFRYNRVEGVYLGLASDKKFYWDGHRLISGYGSLGYGFLTHRWRAQLGLDRQFATGANLFEFGGEGHNLTDTKDDWIISQWENTVAALFLREDDRDYFQREGFSAHGAWYTKAPGLSTMINAEYRYDEYKSLSKNTKWSIFKLADDFHVNPMIDDGTMRSVVLTGGLSTIERWRRTTTGWNTFAQLESGTLDRSGVIASVGAPAFDKNFTRAVIDIRRFQPLSKYDNINLRVRFGSLKGGYILQKGFELGGINTLPAYGFKEFAGNRMVLANVEYALNGSVFDDVNFWPGFLTLMVFADAGNAQFADTKLDLTDGFKNFAVSNMKSDLGFALGWHDESARLGFAWRTDKGGPPMVFLRLSRPF